MNTAQLNIETYLTVQIQQLTECGANHALTWGSRFDRHCWLQISLQDGEVWHFTVQFPLPCVLEKRTFDHIFQAYCESQIQFDGGESLRYYVAQSDTPEQLFAQVPAIAAQIAAAIQSLWNATTVGEIALLGARGPRIPLSVESVPAARKAA